MIFIINLMRYYQIKILINNKLQIYLSIYLIKNYYFNIKTLKNNKLKSLFIIFIHLYKFLLII